MDIKKLQEEIDQGNPFLVEYLSDKTSEEVADIIIKREKELNIAIKGYSETFVVGLREELDLIRKIYDYKVTNESKDSKGFSLT